MGGLGWRAQCYFLLCTSIDDKLLDPKMLRATSLNISQ